MCKFHHLSNILLIFYFQYLQLCIKRLKFSIVVFATFFCDFVFVAVVVTFFCDFVFTAVVVIFFFAFVFVAVFATFVHADRTAGDVASTFVVPAMSILQIYSYKMQYNKNKGLPVISLTHKLLVLSDIWNKNKLIKVSS